MRNSVAPAFTSLPSTNWRFSMIPSTLARTCAVRNAFNRPGRSWVSTTDPGETVTTSTSGGGGMPPAGACVLPASLEPHAASASMAAKANIPVMKCVLVFIDDLRQIFQSVRVSLFHRTQVIDPAHHPSAERYFSGSRSMISRCTVMLCSSYSGSPHKANTSSRLSRIFSPCHTQSTGRQTSCPWSVGKSDCTTPTALMCNSEWGVQRLMKTMSAFLMGETMPCRSNLPSGRCGRHTVCLSMKPCASRSSIPKKVAIATSILQCFSCRHIQYVTPDLRRWSRTDGSVPVSEEIIKPPDHQRDHHQPEPERHLPFAFFDTRAFVDVNGMSGNMPGFRLRV